MSKEDLRIIFMGTPEFAIPSLEILIQGGYNVVAVITSTDKYGGRGGKKLIQSAIKKYALEQNLPILQPKNLKHPDFIEELKSYKANLQIVVAFRMLPEIVWNMPEHGSYNLHGSLLPKYRGAAPINWAIIKGEQSTGVTTFKLKHEIDTGSIAVQKRMLISENATAGDVHDEMMILGAEAVLETVLMIESDTIQLSEQDDSQACPAPKLHKENTEIDFNDDAAKVHNFIRGLSPYPGAWYDDNGDKVKIFKTEKSDLPTKAKPGQIELIEKDLYISCADHYLKINELQIPGKRRMSAKDYINGYLAKN